MVGGRWGQVEIWVAGCCTVYSVQMYSVQLYPGVGTGFHRQERESFKIEYHSLWGDNSMFELSMLMISVFI